MWRWFCTRWTSTWVLQCSVSRCLTFRNQEYKPTGLRYIPIFPIQCEGERVWHLRMRLTTPFRSGKNTMVNKKQEKVIFQDKLRAKEKPVGPQTLVLYSIALTSAPPVAPMNYFFENYYRFKTMSREETSKKWHLGTLFWGGGRQEGY